MADVARGQPDRLERERQQEGKRGKYKREIQTVKYYTISSARGINTGSHFVILDALYYESNDGTVDV